MVKKKTPKKKIASKKIKKPIKKVVKKIKTSKKSTKKIINTPHKLPIKENEKIVEKQLAENFIALQKVMVNLAIKFDNLSTQISKLLNLFEISAKALAEKDFKIEKDVKDNTKILDKIDNLFEQNKIIAKGLTLLHEPERQQHIIRQPTVMPKHIPLQTLRQPKPNPFPTTPEPKLKQQEQNLGEYQESISSQTHPIPNISSTPQTQPIQGTRSLQQSSQTQSAPQKFKKL